MVFKFRLKSDVLTLLTLIKASLRTLLLLTFLLKGSLKWGLVDTHLEPRAYRPGGEGGNRSYLAQVAGYTFLGTFRYADFENR